MVDYKSARHNMVESQLRTNKVRSEPILAAFETVPRELFLPENRRGIAYVDEDIALGHGRFMIEPMVLARLLQAARPGPADMALEVGCGSGYATAILAHIVATVVAVESVGNLSEMAAEALASLNHDNAVVMKGEIVEGWPGQAPYDVILINGAVSEVPQAICDQLAEGGRLVAVVRPDRGMGRAMLFERHAGVVSSRALFDAAVPLLPEFEAAPSFVF